jgi:hypothetical protein
MVRRYMDVGNLMVQEKTQIEKIEKGNGKGSNRGNGEFRSLQA